MTIELQIIIAFVLHLVGDYVFQNDWIASNKTHRSSVAWIHACIYSLPFAFLPVFGVSGVWYIPILTTHFLIDRYRLAQYWIKLVNWNWQSDNFGYGPDKPKWMSVWLMIIIDNVFHVLINTGCILLAHYYPVKYQSIFSQLALQ